MSTTTQEDTLLGAPMSFKEHLLELRKRLVRITIVLLVGTFLTWEYRQELFDFMSKPVADALADNGIYHFQAIHLTESIVVYIKVTVIAAIFLFSPYIFWELWGFVAPGLYKTEKRFILPLTGFSVVFFLIGSAFAYIVIIPFITNWLTQMTLESGHIDVVVTLQNAYSFSFLFLMMFGLVFELPLILFFLALWGLVTAKGLLKFWRYFVVISFIVCGILTPPDPLSQTLMAVPVNVLYGFGVIVAATVARAKKGENVDKGEVSQKAIRAMALSLLGVAAATIGFFLIITGLPRPALSDWAPLDARYVAGFNPKILAAEKAVLGLVKSDPQAAAVIDALAREGESLDEITDAVMIVDKDGRRSVLLEADGLGELAPKLGDLEKSGVAVRAIDEDTLALGDATLTRGLSAEKRSRDRAGERLYDRLQKSGPLWVLVEGGSPVRAALVGSDNATELGSFGAAIVLDSRRRVTFDIPIGDGKPADMSTTDDLASRVGARIEASRVAALAEAAEHDDKRVVGAVKSIAIELEGLATGDARLRIHQILNDLDGLGSKTNEAPAFPALVALAPHLRGVSVRRDERGLIVTSELDDEGLATLFGFLRGRQ